MAQTRNDNQNTTTEPRMVKVAVRINPETIDELRDLYADQKEKITIRMVKIGEWRYPCAIYFLPEDEVKNLKGSSRLRRSGSRGRPGAGFLMAAVASSVVTRTSINVPSATGGSPSVLTTAIRPAMRPCRTSMETRKRSCTWPGKISPE